MKVIAEGLINDFLKSFDMQNFKFAEDKNQDFSKKLEYLVNYIFLSLNSDDRILWETLEDISTGISEGIDGIAIIINGKIVDDFLTLEEISEINDKFNIKLLFSQVKSSERVEKENLNHFLISISKLLNLDISLENENEIVKNFRNLFRKILTEYIGKIQNIEIIALFANLNQLKEEDKLNIEEELKEIFQPQLREIGTLKIEIWGINDIKEYYRKIERNIEVVIRVEDLLPFPEMENIDDAYIGFIKYEEFLKIVEDENGKFRGSLLFYDNPRDFLGFNEVNKDIKKTLETDKYKNFPVLNNGITIVADEINFKKRNLYLKNFQIVNGCQTTYILYSFKDDKRIREIYIPVKFIATQRVEIKNEIIKATNNQTRINKEELEALSDFQKILEEFYKSMNKKQEEKLYYERRKNQYLHENIPKNRIIDMKTQSKVFASMFLKLPHEASGYYGRLTQKFGKTIFAKTHRPYPYYLSSLIFFKLMQLFNRRKINKKFRKFKFHILMLILLIIQKELNKEIPKVESREIDKYCEEILHNYVKDENKFLDIIHNAIDVITKSNIDYASLKSSESVRKLLETFSKAQ